MSTVPVKDEELLDDDRRDDELREDELSDDKMADDKLLDEEGADDEWLDKEMVDDELPGTELIAGARLDEDLTLVRDEEPFSTDENWLERLDEITELVDDVEVNDVEADDVVEKLPWDDSEDELIVEDAVVFSDREDDTNDTLELNTVEDRLLLVGVSCSEEPPQAVRTSVKRPVRHHEAL